MRILYLTNKRIRVCHLSGWLEFSNQTWDPSSRQEAIAHGSAGVIQEGQQAALISSSDVSGDRQFITTKRQNDARCPSISQRRGTVNFHQFSNSTIYKIGSTTNRSWQG